MDNNNEAWVVTKEGSGKYLKRVMSGRPVYSVGRIVAQGIQEGNDLVVLWKDNKGAYTILKLKEEIPISEK